MLVMEIIPNFLDVASYLKNKTLELKQKEEGGNGKYCL